MALILSGINNRTERISLKKNLSGYGAVTVSKIASQAKQATEQSKKIIVKAKGAISSTKAVSSQLTQALSKLKSSPLRGYGYSGYGAAFDPKVARAQLEAKKKNIAQTKQVVAIAKKVVASAKSLKK